MIPLLQLLGKQSLPSLTRCFGPKNRRYFVSLKDNKLWVSGESRPIPWLWLRDACQCDRCVHPSTRQKLHRTSDIPLDISPLKASPIKIDPSAVTLDWPEVSESGDQFTHKSIYPLQWLEHHATSRNSAIYFSPTREESSTTTWTSDTLASLETLWVKYPALLNDLEAKRCAIQQLLRFGILFASGVDTVHKDLANCEIRRLAGIFGRIRDTFYGPVWDVKSIAQSRNIAYTNLNLDLHMDLLYFEAPPRYQVLHSLVNRVVGGTSIFVDALERAHKLRKLDSHAFNTLANTPVNFHYNNDGHFLHQTHPTIELDYFSKSEVRYINYSPPFQAPFPLDTDPSVWKSLSAFSKLLEDPSVRFEYTMQEGDAVIFDNRRVLHARTAFRSKDDAGNEDLETLRWLKGCYLEADALHDQGRLLFA